MATACEAMQSPGTGPGSPALSMQRDSTGSCCCTARRAATSSPAARAAELEPRANRVRVPGGSFRMGSERFYREERPVRQASVEPFWIDVHPVTNAQFRRFVEATGYLTFSERTPDAAQYPDADPALLVPGSLVFTRPAQRVGLRDYRQWWAYVPGASWRHPEGPDSSLTGRDDHPVVHVTYEDALAFAKWSGKALPTEAEWEFAARGGLDGADYPWGDEFAPGDELRANVWIGRFPWESLKPEGSQRTTPVSAFPANGYGLYDVVGNVWEWTASAFDTPGAERSCCSTSDEDDAGARRVVKGGSHLCAPNYCLRYRPAARQGQAIDSSTGHIGFRCIVRDAAKQ
jgi:sulfatase modifying factor 1